VTVPFDSPLLDELFAARWRPTSVDELAARLAVDADRLRAYFTAVPPSPPRPVPADGVRMRFLGHAGVLLESARGSVLLDPIVGYTEDGHEHLRLTDLPDHLDAIVLSHAHSDHVSVETLLQLRHRTGVVIVPGGSGGTVLDPGLAPMLRAMGLRNVVALGDLETHEVLDGLAVTAVPFLGEHADLDIRAKMVPLVEFAGRSFLFATDTVVIEPELFRRLAGRLHDIDGLFVGLECVGAPMSWLYGPLLGLRPKREHDRRRRLSGSDAAMADELARLVGAKRVYSYAMGFEPWLRHMTGSSYDPASEQAAQARKLEELCAARGVPAQLLYLRGEHLWQ
jgi:L-ascorbate metabolism protein UlaG (beta-lactamase superfamily)